jgi:hypothetical protein
MAVIDFDEPKVAVAEVMDVVDGLRRYLEQQGLEREAVRVATVWALMLEVWGPLHDAGRAAERKGTPSVPVRDADRDNSAEVIQLLRAGGGRS